MVGTGQSIPCATVLGHQHITWLGEACRTIPRVTTHHKIDTVRVTRIVLDDIIKAVGNIAT